MSDLVETLKTGFLTTRLRSYRGSDEGLIMVYIVCHTFAGGISGP